MSSPTPSIPLSPSPANLSRRIKADLHLHTGEDPFDEIDYPASELVERAHALGFGALAITLHRVVFDDPAVFDRARKLGILLIPAAELRLEGADVVVLNLSRQEAEAVRTFDDLRALRERRGDSLLVLAPHPYYVMGGSIGSRIEAYLDCFDAIEHCNFHLPLVNPNRRAAALARRVGKTLLATSDCHQRQEFGQHYSWLTLNNGPAEGIVGVAEVFGAIRAGHVERVAPTGGWRRLWSMLWFIFVKHPRLVCRAGSRRTRAHSLTADGTPNSAANPVAADSAAIAPQLS